MCYNRSSTFTFKTTQNLYKRLLSLFELTSGVCSNRDNFFYYFTKIPYYAAFGTEFSAAFSIFSMNIPYPSVGFATITMGRRSASRVRTQCGTQEKFPPLDPYSKGFSCEKCRELDGLGKTKRECEHSVERRKSSHPWILIPRAFLAKSSGNL